MGKTATSIKMNLMGQKYGETNTEDRIELGTELGMDENKKLIYI
jgi:hypothetical protein